MCRKDKITADICPTVNAVAVTLTTGTPWYCGTFNDELFSINKITAVFKPKTDNLTFNIYKMACLEHFFGLTITANISVC